ncbi:MAG: CarD family transcriptional regulator [Lachnospiraceae bacterium]|nr:CarD family transcriptional regulator [Lachnospiraceae bacterium]
MFQKKDYIYSESMGVCKVADITSLAPKKGSAVSYYVLRSVYQKDKTAYIPVENHTVGLRELITPERAMELSEEWRQKETLSPQQTEGQSIRQELENFAGFEMQYKMADTLDEETRKLLYQKGEVEFVLQQEQLKASGKNEKKKKGNNETVAT